jgi:hypothetical protein
MLALHDVASIDSSSAGSGGCFEIVSSDSGGATYVAGWDKPAELTAPFPGYKYDVATEYAYPMKPCATAPGTLCEPACNLTPLTDCGLPEP